MTLLSRMLRALAAVKVIEAWIVVGYRHDLIAAELDRFPSPLPVVCVSNEAYLRGSVRSLWAARQVMSNEVLVMDADVLFPVHLLRRLVQSSHSNCVLVDPRSAFTGEEMMLTLQDDHIWDITRGVRNPSHVLGEGVGFYKLDRLAAPRLRQLLEQWIASGRDDEEYEEAFVCSSRPASSAMNWWGTYPGLRSIFPRISPRPSKRSGRRFRRSKPGYGSRDE